ncbi:MAG TPA: LLM class flavin-dependent oxidoreductase [Xanthobacteraceae bacterium]|nr:LLM class flavin-dependent oxidoreductase [Xanthobacteraceae bacterium]
MRFGLFGGAQAGGGSGNAVMGQGFHDFIELNVEAEALGYESTFVVEHHFTGWNQVSATLTLLTWLAARTRSLRLGTAVMVLPWHNPVILAEQAATLDLLSEGRLDFGVGKGYRHTEFTGFQIPPEEAEARFDEALDVITKAWTSTERFSYRGRFWQFENIVVEPPTYQRPHPPFWMAAGSSDSIRKVARRGYNLILDQFASAAEHGERIALYRAELAALGRGFDPMSITVARDMFVAYDQAEKDAAIERNNRARQQILKVARAPGQERGSHILAYTHYDPRANANTLIGTVDEIAAALEALRQVGVEYVIMSCGGSREALRRFARDVMPAFTGKEPARAAAAEGNRAPA